MANDLKSFHDILQILIRVTNLGLRTFNLDANVIRFSQSGFANPNSVEQLYNGRKCIIMLNNIKSKRVGWQGHSYNETTQTRKDEWIEEQVWQFHFMVREDKNSNTINTLTGDDYCDRICAWFNGQGNTELRKYGIANLNLSNNNVIIFHDASKYYQRRIVLTMKLQVPKQFTTGYEFVDIYTAKTYPI